MLFEYDATTNRIFEMPPYFFFTVIGIVVSSSLFILLLLKYRHNIPRYTKIFFMSGGGLLIGAKLFGGLSGLYIALANKKPITLEIFLNTGIVFLGGLIGFVLTFLLMCKVSNKKIDFGVVDLAVVCIPLFHFWARFGCFFAGCCYGIEADSKLSVRYTTLIHGEIITASRIPVQLFEAGLNIAIFGVLLILLAKNKCKNHFLEIYLLVYSSMRIGLELFRGDDIRGIWNGISFSQFTSIIIICVLIFTIKSSKEKKHENT